MIGRMWRAWATAENADRYEHLLRDKILPELARKLLARFDATAQHYDVRAGPA